MLAQQSVEHLQTLSSMLLMPRSLRQRHARELKSCATQKQACSIICNSIPVCMIRPAVIIAEPEPENALSTRKLVVETAKFNVITAHSAQELRETMEIFPKAHAIVLHQGLPGANPQDMINEIRRCLPKKQVITLSPQNNLGAGDHNLGSHDPEELIDLLRKLFGDPRSL